MRKLKFAYYDEPTWFYLRIIAVELVAVIWLLIAVIWKMYG